MNKGLIQTTLLALVASFSGMQAANANAPVISPLPDITIGDAENVVNGFTDPNYFVYTNAFSFDQKASDDVVAASSLRWSYGEGDYTAGQFTQTAAGNPWYRVNNKDQVATGDVALAALIQGGGVIPGDNAQVPGTKDLRQGPIAGGNDPAYATFRDVTFSPGWGPLTQSFPAPQEPNKGYHAVGKSVWFFVSDGVNVSSDTIIVKTIDNASDSRSPAFDFTKVVDNQFPAPNGNFGWIPFTEQKRQGQDPDGAGSDPVLAADLQYTDYNAASTSLRGYMNTATPSYSVNQKNRYAGWREAGFYDVYPFNETTGNRVAGTPVPESEMTHLKYGQIPANHRARAKFHLFASGQGNTDRNRIPDLELRLGSSFAYANTLETVAKMSAKRGIIAYGADADLIQQELAISGDATKPSIFRVDLVVPNVPNRTDHPTTQGIQRFVQFIGNPTEVQTRGFVSLTESSVGVYPTPAETLKKVYDSPEWTAGNGVGPGQHYYTGIVYDKTVNNGPIQSANQNGSGVGFPLAPIVVSGSAAGFHVSTGSSAISDVNQIATLQVDWVGGALEDSDRTKRVRIEENKQYHARFVVTSTNASNKNATLHFRMRTVDFGFNTRFYVTGGNWIFVNQLAPGTGTSNVNPAYSGRSTFDVLAVTPLHPDIRADITGSMAQKFPLLSTQPGPGSASDSFRDLFIGCDIVDSTNESAALPEKGNMTIHRVEIYEAPLVVD